MERLETPNDDNKFYKESSILYLKEFPKLKNWLGLGGKDEPLVLELLFKASRDTDRASEFWKKCNGKGKVFVFVKSSIGKRFGGYRYK